MSNDGLVKIESNHTIRETIDRVEAGLTAKGITIFARIDHAAAAAMVDMPLRPTELLIFGDPRAGTPLMQLEQSMGIDLPLKMLVWQDQDGKVWLAYNDMRSLLQRHTLDANVLRVADAMAQGLAKLAEAAAA
jgi:uncharacterized protein (DUF302 family)